MEGKWDPIFQENMGWWENILGPWWFQAFYIFTLPGELIQFDGHIFQLGWFNHQLVIPFGQILSIISG